jgi:cbb3-type cytochrome oxidase subunit 3
MNLPTLATVLVSLAFAGLCIWVLWPSNKARFERDALIPLQDNEHPAPRRGTPQ